ncbi:MULTISPECIES: thiamine pyrophosphate-dependent dehydrogenase E1 component subunit alpha [unclassified Novosphingobium]|uniref:thiamine pyrophosphate-dependent dehydrogenase E1 component subunit alpha n=1 Tax=unclassified Novosphingobium TaxID=2644732 RepID=UPI00135B6B01|nr:MULTISPECIES: thiamine pyrophosphate-dependent dehydrogenase E1 component subunit alpha [unclassified Novosphingobium]
MSNYPMPSSDQLLDIYRRAITIKLNDERIIREMKSGRLVTPYYSARGQEIIPASVMQSVTDDDYLCTIYRGTHDMVAKNFPLDVMWAELAGRVTGSCKGKGGTMHLTHPETGSMVTTGIVGSSMPIATGLGWAAKLNGRGQVSIASFGDGACNIGAFHESLNFAGVFDLPVIFLCQNNLYAEHTSMAKSTRVDRYSKRAAGYGIEGVTVNGNDPEEMFGAAKWAIDRARAGEGPTLIEAMTFRFNGHLLGDPGEYIPKEEYAENLAKDPVPALRKRLLDKSVADEVALGAMEAEILARINAAVKAAYAAEYPDVTELKRDVYAAELA